MKYVLRSLQAVLLGLFVFTAISCESTNKPKKKVAVPPSDGDDLSALPWNRPRAFESNAGMGSAMPQSR